MLRILIFIPMVVILVAFALSNQQQVRVGLWPTDIQLDMPLSAAVLVTAALFFVAGAMMTWGGAISSSARARRAERQARQLEAQVQSLRAQSPVPLLPPA